MLLRPAPKHHPANGPYDDFVQSLAEPAKVLSLSFWRDELAVAAWRNRPAHRASQALGRASLFGDYRLRIASVMRDYDMRDRAQAPTDSGLAHGARAPHPIGVRKLRGSQRCT